MIKKMRMLARELNFLASLLKRLEKMTRKVKRK